MHRSRVAAIAIDVPAEREEDTVRFWAGALGSEARNQGDEYTTVGHVAGREVFVQRVDAAARYHLDIETDDVDAEVTRLEALGATKVEQIHSWWVMRDPSGQLFCVVRPQTPDFPGDAATWD